MESLVSDNGPQFSSEQFRAAMRMYKISHVTSSPYHPQSYGLTERAVQTGKKMFKKCIATEEDVYLALLDLNNTPRDRNIGSPTQRLMGRRTKTLLPTTEALFSPHSIQTAAVKQGFGNYRQKQKQYYDLGTKPQPRIGPHAATRISTERGWQRAQ